MRKADISKYQVDTKDSNGNFVTRFTDQDSPEGDITANAEFTLSGSTLELTNALEDPKITVTKKLDKLGLIPC